MIMKKPTTLRTLIFVLALLFNFVSSAQNGIAFNSKSASSSNGNLFVKTDHSVNPFSLDTNDGGGSLKMDDVPEIPNPVIKYAQGQYAGVVSECPNDGKLLPKLFLCGLNDSRLIETGITNATLITWQRRTGGCAPMANSDCANTIATCTWADVANGPNYNANAAGEFRVKIRYADATEFVFYFNVYKNEVDPSGIVKSDIVKDLNNCTIPGKIIAGNFGNGYEYSFTPNPSANVWQDSNTYTVNTAGTYNVFIRLKNVPESCIFNVKGIVVSTINFSSTVTTTQPSCSGQNGSIKVVANTLNNQYNYKLFAGTDLSKPAVASFGPSSLSEYTFSNVAAGSYTIVTTIEGGCATDNQVATLTAASAVINTSSQTTTLTSCTNGVITGSASGGTKPYVYSISYAGGNFELVPNGKYILLESGSYVMRVTDLNGCSVDKTITVAQVDKPDYDIVVSNGKCGESGTIAVNVTNTKGYALEYSINGGNFSNVKSWTRAPGEYTIIVRYSKSSVNRGNWCTDAAQTVNIGATTALTASAGIAALSGCGPDGKEYQGIARITNPQGGTPPYQYWINSTVGWSSSNEGYLDPGGPYTVKIRDSAPGGSCEYVMTGLVIDPKPAAPNIQLGKTIYNCDGTATSTVTINGGSGDPKFSYQYYIDGMPNPNTAQPNVFLNVPQGDHIITVDYQVLSATTNSILLDESFGSGANTQSPGINTFYYCFERQIKDSALWCNGSEAINDGDYSVTSSIDQASTNGWSWRYPVDHTKGGADPKGRFLAVNIGDQIPETTILYEKQINDVIPNQPINFEFYAMNLMMPGAGKADPNLRIALVDASGTEISWFATGNIPRSNTNSDWKKFPQTAITLNPGNNTTLRLIVRSNIKQTNGNDVAIDDIKVFQTPRACGTSVNFPFKINTDKIFTARVDDVMAVQCSGQKNGSFNIYAENYNVDFEYSIEGGAAGTWKKSTTSPVTISGLGAKSYDVRIRYNSTSTNCSFTIPTVVNSPTAFTVIAQTEAATCSNDGKVILTPSGGVGPYTFVLTQKSNGATTNFEFNSTTGKYEANAAPGVYTVAGTDANTCPTSLGTDVNVSGTAGPSVSIDDTSNFCFNTTTGASIKVNVSGGRIPYTYEVSLDGGLNYGAKSAEFSTSSFTYPVTATGVYVFRIVDKNGCDVKTVSTTINPQLGAKSGIKAALSCKTGATAAIIEVTVEDGTAPYNYVIKNSLGNQVGSGTTSTTTINYSTTIADTYTFEISDFNKCPITIKQKVEALVQVTAKSDPHDATCFGGMGSVDLEGLTGLAPYTFEFNGTGGFVDQTHFANLSGSVAGTTYSFRVKDANDCIKSYTFKIFQPADISGEAKITIPYTCDNQATITVSNVAGGTPQYQYTLIRDGVAVVGPQTGLTFPNLSTPGVYEVKITDKNSCAKTVPAGTINALNRPAAMTITTTTAATCPSNKGGVTITNVRNAAGVVITGALEYRIIAPITAGPNSTGVFNNLDANVEYTFEVRDANQCKITDKHKIDPPASFTVGSKSTAVKCFGDSNGTATFTVTGIASGTNYTYKVDALAVQNGTSTGSPFNIVISGLTAGSHSITVTNSTTNCPITENVTVGGPTAALKLNTPDLTHVTCLVKGTATIYAVDGSGSYTYTVTPTSPAGAPKVQSNDNKFVGLNAGAYSVSVSDLTGCVVGGQNFTINDSVDPSATISVTSSYCAGGTGATLITSPTVAPQPNPNYEYKINNGSYQPSGTFSGLTPGKYTITVRDIVTGCTAELAEETILAPLSATVKIDSDLTCDPTSPEAIIGVTIQNGYPDYRYRVNTTGAPFSGGYTNVGTGLTKFTVARLAGTYYFEITDSKGCTVVVSQTVNSTVKPDFTTDLVNVLCKGNKTGSITVNATQVGTYTYEVTPISPAGAKITQTTNLFENLGAGSYSVVVIDAKKCASDAKTVSIAEPLNGLTATAGVDVKLTCDASNGTVAAKITVSASGGTPFATPDLYRYSYNGTTPVTSNEFTTTASGNVTIEVFDASGCPYVVPGGVTIDALNPPSGLTITPSNVITCDVATADLRLEFSNGVGPFTYEITNPTASIVSVNDVNRNHTFTALAPGHYYFKVTDANKCTVTGNFEILNVGKILSEGLIVSNVTCNGANNGSIKFTVSGNRTGGYTYNLVGSVTGTITLAPAVSGDVITYSGLSGGQKYTFTVTNTATKCVASSEVTLAEPIAITAFEAKASNIYCSHAKTNIVLTATAGTSVLYYALTKAGDPAPSFPTDYNTTGLFNRDTSIDGISYTAYVINKDGNCRQSLALGVLSDTAPSIDPITAAQCYSGSNFNVTITGSTYNNLNVTYGLNGVYDTNPVKTITGQGNYTLGIKDDHGCPVTTTIYVNDLLTIKADLKKNLTCPTTPPTATAAQIELSATGGDGTYVYEYKLGTGGTYATTGTTFNPTVDGDYYFKVTSDGCSVETTLPVKVTIPEPPVITGVTEIQSIKCSGDETAAIEITIDNSKGVGPFVFNVLRTGPTVFDYGTQTTGLAAGTYTITVTDSKGCTGTYPVNINQPNPITFTLDKINIQCTGGTYTLGSVIVQNVLGGTAPFTYYITNNFGDTIPFNPYAASAREDHTFKDLINFGIYTVTAVDANGCRHSESISITSPPKDLQVVIDTSAPNCSSGTAVVTVKASPLGSNYTFAILTTNVPPFSGTFLTPDVAGGDTKTFTGLTPGVTYTFVVHDGDTGCDLVNTADIPIPGNSKLAPDVTPKNVSCKGANDGSVSINISGYDAAATSISYQIFTNQSNLPVTGVLTYNVGDPQPITYPALPAVGNMVPGYYYITFTENGGPNNGCKKASDPFYIRESAVELSVKASVFKNENCDKLGIIIAEAKDGTGPYTYFQNTTGTLPTVTDAWQTSGTFNLAEGTYYIFAKDNNDCIKPASAPVTLIKDPDPVFGLAVANLCAAQGSFVVNVTVTDPTPSMGPYTVSVNAKGFVSMNGTTYAATGLNAGTQTIIVKNKNGCPTTHTININEKPAVTAVPTKVISCPTNGSTVEDAIIHVEITKGTGDFQYSYTKDSDPSTAYVPVGVGQTSFDFPVSSANAGTYIFQIKDANNCIAESGPVIIKPNVPIVPNSDTVLANCFGGNGTIKLSADGGQKPYQFSFNSLPFSDEANYSAAAGTYSFIVRDALGCEASDNVTLAITPDLILGTPAIDQPVCGPLNAPQQAKVVLAASGGTGTLEYSFNNSAFSTETTYFVTENGATQTIPYAVRDQNGCPKTGTVTINYLDAPRDFDLTPSGPITCIDITTTITISNVDHGVMPFTYQIVSPTTAIKDNNGNPAFSGLAPGTYVFQVTDANKCTKQIQYEIKDVIKIKIEKQSLTDITCVGAGDGKATFIVSGFGTGAGTYNYVLDTDGPVTMSTGTINLTGLAPGAHKITVIDNATGCDMPFNFNIATPLIPLDFAIDVTPLGCSTFGAVKFTATNGWGAPYTYTVTEPAPSVTVLPSNTTGTFGGLTKTGTYTIDVKDAKGCVVSKTFELTTPIEPVASIDTSSVYCYTGSGVGQGATIVVNATTPGTPAYTPVYEYSIDNGGKWFTNNTFTDLAPATYQVTVRDQYGCTDLTSAPVEIKGQIFASAKKDTEIFCGPVDGLIKLEVAGGYAPFSYTVTKNGVLVPTVFAFPTPTATTADFVVDGATGEGDYTFTITDSQSCTVTTTLVHMSNPTLITYTATPTSPSCVALQGNGANGQILVELTGAALADTQQYTYTLTPSVGLPITQTTGLFTGLTAGTYSVTVSSARSCAVTQNNITIAVPPAVTAIAKSSDFTCTQANVINQTIVTVTGSHGAAVEPITNFTYSDNGSDWYLTNEFKVDNDPNNIQHLTYYVKDLKGCMASYSIDINPFPTLISATPSLSIAADCPNGGKETIKVDIVGGATPYNFEYQVAVDGAPYGAATGVTGTNTFDYVAPDAGYSYQFKITDLTTGCAIISSSYDVKLYNLMTVTATPSTMVSCDGFNDGAITIAIDNYTGLYDYRVLLAGVPVVGASGTNINAGTNNPYVITGLSAGKNYTVEVTQNAYPNCTVISNPVEITQPTPVDISGIVITVKNQNCRTTATGAVITVDPTTISGGTPGYKYAFVPAGTTPVDADYQDSNIKSFITAQIAPLFDSYDVYVKDLNGCNRFQNVHISVDPLPVISNVTVASQCASAAGYRIDITATGLAKLQYSLDGVQYQDDNFFIVTEPGDYTVWVWDKNQCAVQATTPVTVFQPLTLRAETKLPLCKDSDGIITLFATGGSVTPPNNYIYTKDNWANSQVNSDFTGLSSGTYTFKVRDLGTNCEKEITEEITIPTEILGMVLTPKKVSCKGYSDGAISVSISDTNDNPTYKYSISGPGVNIVDQISSEFKNLAYGTYTVTVKSGRGCELAQSILVDEPAEVVATTSYTEFICTTGNTRNNATISIDNVTGGSGKYILYQFIKGTDIVQSGTSTIYTVNDRTGGNYTVKVFDENGCVGTSATPIQIAPFASLDDITFNVTTPITCVNNETIQVNVPVTGTLTAPLEYTISGTNGTVITPVMNNTGIFPGLGIGDYLISVLNPATGCVISDYHHVFNPNTFILDVKAVSTKICYGTSTGNVEITMIDTQPLPLNEAGVFDYTITGPNGIVTGRSTGVTLPLTGLSAGRYTIAAKLVNSPECEVTGAFEITQPVAPLTIAVSHTRITCAAGGNDGTISVSVDGGWPGGHFFELVGPVSHEYSEEYFFENLTPGHYIVNVKDSEGCIATDVVDLVIPDPIQFTAVATTPVLTCYGDDNGIITVSIPTGGEGANYTYTLNHTTADGEVISSVPQDSNIFTGLIAGNYTVTVVDSYTCQATSATVTINNPTKIEASLSQETRITCLQDATLTLTATGGTGPYTYSKDGITSLGSFSSSITFPVSVGAHHYFVTDNLGCVSDASGDVRVDPIEPLTIELDLKNSHVNCTGQSTAIVNAIAKGGLGNYQYSLLDGSKNEIRIAQADGLFTELSAGNYFIHLKSEDCETDQPFTVTESPNPLVSNYTVDPVKCNGDKSGRIVITASGGTGVIKYAIEPHLDQFVDSGTFEGLVADTYTVIVQDILGCFNRYEIKVDEPGILIAYEVPNSMIPEICKGDKDGAFSIEIAGGTAPYFASLDNEKGPFVPVNGTEVDYTGLSGGVHTVYVRDTNLCSIPVQVNMPEPVVLNPTAEVTYDCVNNAQANMVVVTVDASNNPTDVDYSLDNNGTYQPSNIFTNVPAGTHFIVARHTNGCEVPTATFDVEGIAEVSLIDITNSTTDINVITVKASGGIAPYEYSFNGEPFSSSNTYRIYKTGDYPVIVRDKNGCEATIIVHGIFYDFCMPNYFTPNGAGSNTTIGPDCGALAYKELTFDIFDRYGRAVAKYRVGQKWDGKYNGNELPTGDYWYVLKLNDPKDNREFVGHFTLYR